MKYIYSQLLIPLLIIIIIAPCFISCGSSESKKNQDVKNLKGDITISGAFALYPLAVKWAEEFKKENPNITINISAGGAGKGMTDVLSGMSDLAMFSREISKEEISKNAWAIPVAKDAVVATISKNNPMAEDLLKSGLTKADFIAIFVEGKFKTWGDVFHIENNIKLNIYTRSDACGAAEVWAKYLGSNQESLKGIGVFGDPGIANAIKSDPNGIGYNNLVYVYDVKTRKKYDGIEVIPIDLNENGEIDPDERFYETIDHLSLAIANNKYPSPPARDLYFVSKGKPTNPLVLAFLNWVMNDGQKYVTDAGFIKLSKDKLLISSGGIEKPKHHFHHLWLFFTILISTILILAIGIAWYFRFSILDIFNISRFLKDRISSIWMIVSMLIVASMPFVLGYALYSKSQSLIHNQKLTTLLFSEEWKPLRGLFGFWPYLLSSLWVTLLAVLISAPICLLTAIYLTNYAKRSLLKIMQPTVDILAGIPSVIFGVWGILIIVPFVSKIGAFFGVPNSGYTILTGSIVLSIMIIPFILNILIEVFRNIPSELKEASLSLGATDWETVKYVLIKKAFPGIISAIGLGLSRAFGETIAVLMVVGNVALIPHSIFDPGYPIPALIANNYGEMLSVPQYDAALMFAALILFVVVIIFNLISRIYITRYEKLTKG